MSKTCRICKAEKELSEFFKNCGTKDGLQGKCKVCDVAATRAWQIANRERLNAYQRARGSKYTDAARAWHKANYQANKDKIKARCAAWWASGSPKVRAARQRSDAKRRALLGVVLGSHTDSEWSAILRSCGWCCANCKKARPLTKDHIVPLSRGGTNNADNLQPLCQPCNSSKGTATIDYLKRHAC